MIAVYVSSNQFTVDGDKTEEFNSGRRLKLDCGVDGIKYETVVSSSYSSPNTTVTIIETNLTSNLSTVLYGIVQPGIDGSLPTHDHSDYDGQGGLINYVTETEFTVYSGTLQAQIDNKSDISHLHDDRYYTESEVNTISGSLSLEIDSDISTHSSSADHDGRYYTESEVDVLLSTISGGGGASTFIGLTDTPSSYDNNKYLKSTTSGTVWSTIDTSSGGTLISGSIGLQSIKVEWKDVDEIYLNPGTIHINDNGTNKWFSLNDRLTKQLTSLSNDTWYYIYIKPPAPGGDLTVSEIEYSTDAPAISYTKLGYYHSTNTTWRCVFAVLTDGSGNLEQHSCVGKYVAYVNSRSTNISNTNVNTSASPNQIDFVVPNFVSVVGAVFITVTYNANASLYYSIDSASSSSIVGTNFNTAGRTKYDFHLVVCGGGVGYVWESTSTSNTYSVVVEGYMLPDYLFTGAAVLGSIGSDTFLELSDTPSTYSDNAGKYLQTTSSGIEFVNAIDADVSLWLGKQSLKVVYKDTDQFYVNPGFIDIKGNLYKNTSQITTTVSGLSTETWYYVYIKPPATGTALSTSEVEYTSTAPIESVTDFGYYHGTNTTWRCVGALYSDSSGNIYGFISNRGRVDFLGSLLVFNDTSVSTTWETKSIIVPLWSDPVSILRFRSMYSGSTTAQPQYRRDSSSVAVGLGYIGTNSTISDVITDVCCSSGSSIDINVDAGSGHTMTSWTNGFVLPDLIYTGM